MALYPYTSDTQVNIPVPSQYIGTMCIPDCQSNVTGAAGYWTGLENYSFAQVEKVFGANQQATRVIKSALINIQNSAIKPFLQAYVKADNGSGIAATRTLTITGTATSSGTYSIGVASNSQSVGLSLFFNVNVGDTATVIGNSIAAAFNASIYSPFTAANVSGVVTLTATNAGTTGNYYFLNLTQLPTNAGFVIVDAAGVTGAVDPDWTDIINNLTYQNTKIDFFGALASHTALIAVLEASLAQRSANVLQYNNQDLSGVLLFGNHIDPTTEAATLAATPPYQARPTGYNILSVFNKKCLGAVGYSGDYLFTTPHELVCELAAVSALRITVGANIAANMIEQSTGRPAQVSVPIHETILPFAGYPVLPNYRWQYSERVQMESYHFGLMAFDNNNTIAGNLFTFAVTPQYVTYEGRLGFYMAYYLFVNIMNPYLSRKYIVQGTSFDPSQIDRLDVANEAKYIYFLLNGTNRTDPNYSNYWAGILDNSDNNLSAFLVTLNNTLIATTQVIAGVPKGVVSFSAFLTIPSQVQILSIVQLNNLIPQ